MKRIRSGVIGAGFMGGAHVEAIRRLGYADVVAIANPRNVREKAEAMCIEHYFSDYKDMIDTMDLDVVHICTPNNTHCEMALYAYEHGVNVVCEKPMCWSVEEAEKMLEAAVRSGLVHAVNFHNRFYPITHQLRNMIKEGQLGKIFSIHGGYIQDWLLYDTDYNWRLLSKESGKTRAVADIGSHWMDIAEYLTGLSIVEVFAEFGIFHKVRKVPSKSVEAFACVSFAPEDYKDMPMDTEDFAAIMLRFNNGAIGNAVISQMFAGKKNKMNIFIGGSDMSAEWDADSLNDLIIGRRNEPNGLLTKDPNLVCAATKAITGYPGGHTEGYPDAFKQTFNNIYKYIMDKNSLKEFADFEDGLRLMILNERIYESAQTGKWIKV